MVRGQRSGPSVTAISVTEAKAHLDQAHEYLRAAQFSLSNGDWNAAAGIAVMAGINAADAVSGFVNGNRWSGAHEQVAAHVEAAGPGGAAVSKQLRKLIRVKNLGQYEARPVRSPDAAALVEAADRAVAAADRARTTLDNRQRR